MCTNLPAVQPSECFEGLEVALKVDDVVCMTGA